MKPNHRRTAKKAAKHLDGMINNMYHLQGGQSKGEQRDKQKSTSKGSK